MATEKQRILVNRLASRTEAGYIHWEETEIEGVFQVSFSSSSVQISLQGANTPEPDVVIRLFNAEGKHVDEFSDRDVADGDFPAYRIMYEMFETARSQALGVEQVLDSLLADLGPEEVPF
ncbi:hypothetical protein KAT84_02240 [Candidatus Bipolaricaulota bacterium]|nr:hypothetical protein [Candidatus Bipolaricaulota bacterium]